MAGRRIALNRIQYGSSELLLVRLNRLHARHVQAMLDRVGDAIVVACLIAPGRLVGFDRLHAGQKQPDLDRIRKVGSIVLVIGDADEIEAAAGRVEKSLGFFSRLP